MGSSECIRRGEWDRKKGKGKGRKGKGRLDSPSRETTVGPRYPVAPKIVVVVPATLSRVVVDPTGFRRDIFSYPARRDSRHDAWERKHKSREGLIAALLPSVCWVSQLLSIKPTTKQHRRRMMGKTDLRGDRGTNFRAKTTNQ